MEYPEQSLRVWPVRFNGAVYQEDWKNIQLSFLGANGLSEVRNAGIARIRGIEMDVGYRAGGFTLNIGGSYNDAEIRRDFCRIANPAFDCALDPGDGRTNALLAEAGTQLPVTAKFKGNAIARYEFPVAGWDGHVQGAASYIGRRRSDLRDVENAIKGDFDPYTTVDLSFGMKKDNLRFEVFATNLLDERGIKATFFFVGQYVRANPEQVREVVRRGHNVASHSWSHPTYLRYWAREAQVTEVRRSYAALEAALADAPAAASVLVKGSRFMQMERVVQALQQEGTPCS